MWPLKLSGDLYDKTLKRLLPYFLYIIVHEQRNELNEKAPFTPPLLYPGYATIGILWQEITTKID